MHGNIASLIQACEQLGIDYRFGASNHNVVELKLEPTVWFVNSASSFNPEALAKLCRDKDFCYQLLQDQLALPPTLAFFDPLHEQGYDQYKTATTYDQVVDQIRARFDLPLVVKPNSGAGGRLVALCHSPDEVLVAVERIFDHRSSHYDYVLLAQAYLPILHEWRVVVFDRQVVLAYKKDPELTAFSRSTSQQQWQREAIELIDDAQLLAKMTAFTQPIWDQLPIRFSGLDIVETESGEWYLLEVNTQPWFGSLLKQHGQAPLVAMYASMLSRLI